MDGPISWHEVRDRDKFSSLVAVLLKQEGDGIVSESRLYMRRWTC